ncbi:hypothetical protein ZIOFF_016777 [Zingiber officinale]|uniref:NB-ARC domain-containing protein n=1 Tax=Zingiber officinale TaxID=94328 RepID=A0A8J5HET6_ZINOF|nr:hypothetical protein ZIOFF_016777 [Zingiber officinale]
MACINLNLNVDINSCLSRLWASLRLGRPRSGIEKLEKEMARLRGKRDQRSEPVVTKGGGIGSCNCFNQTGGPSSQTQQAGDQVPIRESSNCFSIIRRVAKKLGEANELMSRASALVEIATIQPPDPIFMLPISHRSPVGIESYVEDIVSYIDGGEGNIIGIYGMGGVGKTTVLKSIQQHYLLKHSKFDRVIWVVASKDCQLKRLQMDIAKSLGLKTLQENLQLLGMAHSATEQGQQQQPSKVVVFTTRNETVCAQMEIEKKIKVKCLDPNQAWQLFKNNSDGNVLNSDAGIKSCALDLAKECADYDIHKFDELIPCWIGCGIIREFNVINEAFTEGCSHLEALMAASLLEHSRRQDYYEAQHVKMHDIIRDMALLALKENGRKWNVKAGIGLSHLPIQEEWQEVERASFADNEIKSLQDHAASNFPKLSMLNLHSNNVWEIPLTLSTNMPLLTYLNLSLNLGITKLPREIGNLTELQYLNLSETSITSLPAKLGCLGKLEYLLLRDTKLETVPMGVISNLSMLKWLDIREIYPKIEWWWGELEYFSGRHLISLGIIINPANLKRLNSLSNVYLWNVTIKGLGSSKFPDYKFPEYKFSECDLSTLQWNALMSTTRINTTLECLEISDIPGDKLMMSCILNLSSLKTLF